MPKDEALAANSCLIQFDFIADAGDQLAKHSVEFLTATIRNENSRSPMARSSARSLSVTPPCGSGFEYRRLD
jgi:hypothetical protein